MGCRCCCKTLNSRLLPRKVVSCDSSNWTIPCCGQYIYFFPFWIAFWKPCRHFQDFCFLLNLPCFLFVKWGSVNWYNWRIQRYSIFYLNFYLLDNVFDFTLFIVPGTFQKRFRANIVVLFFSVILKRKRFTSELVKPINCFTSSNIKWFWNEIVSLDTFSINSDSVWVFVWVCS